MWVSVVWRRGQEKLVSKDTTTHPLAHNTHRTVHVCVSEHIICVGAHMYFPTSDLGREGKLYDVVGGTIEPIGRRVVDQVLRERGGELDKEGRE